MRQLALVLALAACAPSPTLLPSNDAGTDVGADPGRVCIPGAQLACACFGGVQGVQTCAADGRSLGACACPDGGGVDAGGGSDTTTSPDVIDERPLADAPVVADVGPADVGSVDAGTPDAGGVDAGALDAGRADVGAPDAGPMDSGAPDAGPMDSGAPDAGPMDSGAPDVGAQDAGPAISCPARGGGPNVTCRSARPCCYSFGGFFLGCGCLIDFGPTPACGPCSP